MTKKQQTALKRAHDIGYYEGKILAWEHVAILCKCCIEANKKQLKELKGKEQRE